MATTIGETHPRVVMATWSFLGAVVLCIAPPSLLLVFSPDLVQGMVFGAIAWLAAVVIKMAVGGLSIVKRFISSGKTGAAAWGTFSGVAELGVFACAMIVGPVAPQWANGAAAGVGAASTEIIFVLMQGIYDDIRKPNPARFRAWLRGARRSLWVTNMTFVERLAATMLHVGTRGLMGIGVGQVLIVPIVFAVLSFTAVDGVATFGAVRRWNWFNPILCRRFCTFVLLSGVLSMLFLFAFIVWMTNITQALT